MSLKKVFCLSALLLFVLLSVSCGSSSSGTNNSGDYTPTAEDLEFINAIPDIESLAMNIPSSSGDNTESEMQAKIGATAQFYLVTRKSMRDLNYGLESLLSIISEVFELQPTESTADSRTWQAEEPLSGMDAFVPRFRMNRIDATGFYFIYEWRPKDDPAGWTKIWWGEVYADANAVHRGKGEMKIDYDSAAAIDPSVVERGQLDMEFDTRPDSGRSITVTLSDFYGEAGDESPTNGTFGFSETPELEGVFSFDIEHNWAQESYEYENLAIETRWQADGVGQSQVVVTGDGIDIDNAGLKMIEVRECWNGSFKQTYSVNIYHFKPGSDIDEQGLNPLEQDEAGDNAACPYSFKKQAD